MTVLDPLVKVVPLVLTVPTSTSRVSAAMERLVKDANVS